MKLDLQATKTELRESKAMIELQATKLELQESRAMTELQATKKEIQEAKASFESMIQEATTEANATTGKELSILKQSVPFKLFYLELHMSIPIHIPKTEPFSSFKRRYYY